MQHQQKVRVGSINTGISYEASAQVFPRGTSVQPPDVPWDSPRIPYLFLAVQLLGTSAPLKKPTKTNKPNDFYPIVQQQLHLMVTCTSAPQNPTDPGDLQQFTGGNCTQPALPNPGTWMSPWAAALGPKCNTLLNTCLDQSPNYQCLVLHGNSTETGDIKIVISVVLPLLALF